MLYAKVLVLLYLQTMHILYLAIVHVHICQKKRSWKRVFIWRWMSSKARISFYLFKICLPIAVRFIKVNYLLQYFDENKGKLFRDTGRRHYLIRREQLNWQQLPTTPRLLLRLYSPFFVSHQTEKNLFWWNKLDSEPGSVHHPIQKLIFGDVS
jgi:hypothetical protein